jgi:hypothetical protein
VGEKKVLSPLFPPARPSQQLKRRKAKEESKKKKRSEVGNE